MVDNPYNAYIKRVFDAWKMKGKTDFWKWLPILDDSSGLIGWLCPIPKNHKELIPGLPKLLGQWRRENPSLSASVFEITEENTTYWLDNLIINRDDRILFLVRTKDDALIGHMGYSSFNFDECSAEIDCVLRGVPSPVPKLMTHALNTLLKWGKDYILLRDIYLSTGRDNIKSIQLYTRCGFQKLHDVPLYRRELENEVRWDEDPNGDPTKAEKMGYQNEIH